MSKNKRTMRRAADEAFHAIEDDILALTLEIHGELVESTPVDTGFARNNWVITNGAPAVGVFETGSAPDPGMAIATAKTDVPMYITNNVQYIGKLNQGHSPQAPAEFVQRDITKVIERRKNRRLQ